MREGCVNQNNRAYFCLADAVHIISNGAYPNGLTIFSFTLEAALPVYMLYPCQSDQGTYALVSV